MKIRLISDLHIDINHKYPISIDDNIFTIVAGDISGNPQQAASWLKSNIKNGIFISGNHDVYDADMPIEDVKAFYHKEFPEDNAVVYCDVDVGVMSKDLGNGIIVVADVLYTDYELKIAHMNATGNVERNMRHADPYMSFHGGGMNDFNYGECKEMIVGWNDGPGSDKGCGCYRLVPPYYLKHHRKAFHAMQDIIEKNADKQIIVVSHHGLSPQCFDINYHDGEWDASYASDKEDWIKNHANIKCIASGHVHAWKKFNVGSCLYVMNSLGYCNQHLKQFNKDTNSQEMWTPNCFIDTDSWTVEWQHIENDAWEKQYEDDNSRFMKYASMFM